MTKRLKSLFTVKKLAVFFINGSPIALENIQFIKLKHLDYRNHRYIIISIMVDREIL